MMSWHVCVDAMLAPLGMVTLIGLLVGCRLLCGLWMLIKSSVVPVSAMAKFWSDKVGGVRLGLTL
jgi:hypothetical protein